MGVISDFCKSRMIPENIEDSFTAYIRSSYAQRFMIKKDGDTVKLVVSKMSKEQVEHAWGEFVKELRQIL